MDYRQIKAIEKKNKQRILAVCPDVPETSGIYFLTREENGFKYAYIGQAKHLLTRLAQHLNGYQHIDLSLKKHGLKSKDNPCGWNVEWIAVSNESLDNFEQYYIKQYALKGYQLRNKTSGSQGKGKQGLDDQKSPKGYYDGLKQGYKNGQKFVANLFEKHLTVATKKDPPTKLQENALAKFKDFLRWGNDDKKE